MRNKSSKRPPTPLPASQVTNVKTRLRGLDGIRAIAAFAVLAFHLLPEVAPAGFIGVDVFFVLSGFLITALLLEQREAHGYVNLKRFWLRRCRRLLPAVVATVAGACALALAVGGDALVALPRQALGAVTATYNWVELFSGASYFEESSPLLLTNMWSLAVEQQFYLVWPFAIMAVFSLRSSRQCLVAFVLGCASVGWHGHLVEADVSRAYMGTDSHMWGLMVGAMVAFTVPYALHVTNQRSWHPYMWGTAGVVGLIGVIAMVFVFPETFMYPWAMVVASVCVGFTIRSLIPDVSCEGPARVLAALLDIRPLTWLGERSYGIYLWHWPIWVLLFYSFPDLDLYVNAAIVVVVSVVLAAASYAYIECPIRQEGFAAWLKHLMRAFPRKNGAMKVASLLIPSLVLGGAGWALAISPGKSSAEIAVEAGMAEGAPAGPGSGGGEADPVSSPRPSDAGGSDPVRAGVKPNNGQAGPTGSTSSGMKPEGAPVTGAKVTVIGDSITVGSSGGLKQRYPGISVDAKVSRSIQKAPGLIQGLRSRGELREYVVVSLATNSAITDRDVDVLVEDVGPGHKIVLVTGFGPRRATWLPETNAAIMRAAERHHNVYVADWNAKIRDRRDLLAGDSIHPAGAEGVGVYVDAVSEALEQARKGA